MKIPVKQFVLFFIFLLISKFNLFAQSDSTPARNTFHTEGFGNGLLASINYDRIFFVKKQKMSWRVGFFLIPLKESAPYLFFPFELNFLFGKKHHFETGIGVTYIYEGITIEPSIAAIFGRVAGYRYQRPNGGFFFRAGAAIVLVHYFGGDPNFVPFFPNLSLGYTIKKDRK
jgi:hypothetical protein